MEYQIRHYHRRAPSVPGFSYQYRSNNKPHDEGPKPNDVQLWYNGNDIHSAEAACARLYHNQSRCTTRIVPHTGDGPDNRDNGGSDKSNLLLIMLDPMSRGQFERSMPQTRSALNDLGFIHFGNFTSVGPNCMSKMNAILGAFCSRDSHGCTPSVIL